MVKKIIKQLLVGKKERFGVLRALLIFALATLVLRGLGINMMGWLLQQLDYFANTVWWNVLGALLFIGLVVVCIRNVMEIEREQKELDAGVAESKDSYITIIKKVMK